MEPHLYAPVLIRRTANTSPTESRDLSVFLPVAHASPLNFFPQGSDFFTIYVRPTTSPLVQREGETRVSHDDGRLPEEIRFAKFCSIVWTHDNKGFFYQVNAAILHVILCPYLPSSRGTQSAFRMGKPHQTRPELKLPATSMPSCITIESALHSVSVSYIPGFRDANLRLDVLVQLTTF